MARKCQEEIDFWYLDLVAAPELHLTLGQVGVEGKLTPGQLDDLRDAARRGCARIAPLRFTVGALGGTAGAIGFAAYASESIVGLRNALREATAAIVPEAPSCWPETQPHVSIAYANADVPAAAAIMAVEKLHAMHTEVTVRDVALVLVERRAHAYAWETVHRIPLAD